MSTNVKIGCGTKTKFNPLIVVPDQSFDIKDGVDTNVRVTDEGGKKVYRVDVSEFGAPFLLLNNNPAQAEVGDTVSSGNVRFTVKQGSDPILTIASSPDVGAISVDVEKDVAVSSITRNTPGFGNQIALTITDDKSIQTVINTGIPFKHRFFQGITTAADLDEAAIEALVDIESNSGGQLGDSIIQLYGGSKDYVVPSDGFNRYIHWLYPVGTTAINNALFNEFPVALTTLSDKAITNAHGLALTYKHVRTSLQLSADTYSIKLV